MNNEFDSDDDFPLADLMPLSNIVPLDAELHRNTSSLETLRNDNGDLSDESLMSDYLDDSDNDPTFEPGKCKMKHCKESIFAACVECLTLLCYDHFTEDVNSCAEHGERPKQKKKTTQKRSIEQEPCDQSKRTALAPESYAVEGERREEPQSKKSKNRVNKQKEAKMKRDSGKQYISPKTKQLVKEKNLGKACNATSNCQKLGRQCLTVTQEQRELVFQEFYKLNDLHLQREFIVRHVETNEALRYSSTSRRSKTHAYFLTISGKRINVCQKFFRSTLGISEKFARTALSKLSESGIVEGERRGRRQSEKVKARDEMWREQIRKHIDRFPRVESHYCRASTSKEYLHSDLTLPKMYEMFIGEACGDDRPSYTTYSRVFNEMNLSFHRPKKDQCSLCMSFLKGSESHKEELRVRYTAHIAEKVKVRELKDKCKEEAQSKKDVLCATFDLQQVIHLPISKENALFYKRRLANYNLTFYNIGNGACECYTWHEGQSKRGSSEVATTVHNALKDYDKAGIRKAYLFSDGCPGQNKNSIFPAMLLYTVNHSVNLEEISLRYFESFHGQNEGDSAHSAITTALKQAGDLFVPSQLIPIFRLARRKRPYSVHPLQSEDFLDFKKLSQDLKVLSLRPDSDGKESINWTKIMEVKVSKESPSTILYKTSHLEKSFKILHLKRQQADVKKFLLTRLNDKAIKIPAAKYGDLLSLCGGSTPLIKSDEHKAFYISLPQ